MRSLDLLVRTYPEKTGAEILEIVEKEKQDNVLLMEKLNKTKLDLIKEYNENGCFYKGTFGLNQYFARKFIDFRLLDDVMYCDVESIVIFKDSVGDRLSVTLRVQDYVKLENYSVVTCERITEKQYNEIAEYYENSVFKFWEKININ